MLHPRCLRKATIANLVVLCFYAFAPLAHSFTNPQPLTTRTVATTAISYVNSADGVENSESFSSSSLSSEEVTSRGGHSFEGTTLEGSERIDFTLTDHKPLGCAVEESLAKEPDDARYVFVSQVSEGGNAANAGIEVGDVVVQLSATFDEVVDVAGLGIEKIKSLVAGRPRESPLVVCVARGNDVIERHEKALVDLCLLGDKAADDCIDAIYNTEADDYLVMGDEEINPCNSDDEMSECMLDSMWGSWSEGLEELPVSDADDGGEAKVEKKKKKVAPWSSRSSGSGTYVRDPKTGKMVNIDE